MAEMTFTARDKQKAIAREIGYRRRVYARKVEDGSMTREAATMQIGVMEAIEADYRKLADDEDAKGRLL